MKLGTIEQKCIYGKMEIVFLKLELKHHWNFQKVILRLLFLKTCFKGTSILHKLDNDILDILVSDSLGQMLLFYDSQSAAHESQPTASTRVVCTLGKSSSHWLFQIVYELRVLFDGSSFCVGLWHSKRLREAGSRSLVTPAILRPPWGGRGRS